MTLLCLSWPTNEVAISHWQYERLIAWCRPVAVNVDLTGSLEHYILFQTAKTSKKRRMGGGDVSVEDSPSHPHPLFCHICIQLSECKYDDAIAPYRRAPSLRISILCARVCVRVMGEQSSVFVCHRGPADLLLLRLLTCSLGCTEMGEIRSTGCNTAAHSTTRRLIVKHSGELYTYA